MQGTREVHRKVQQQENTEPHIVRTGKLFRNPIAFLKVFSIASSVLSITRSIAPNRTARFEKIETSIGSSGLHYFFSCAGLPLNILNFGKGSLLEHAIDLNWIVVDIFTVGFTLDQFKIFDTEKLSLRIGRLPCMGRIPGQCLLHWMVGLCVVGNALSAYNDSVKESNSLRLNGSRERDQIQADKRMHQAETVYQIASLLHLTGWLPCSLSYIHLLNIAAKSFGVRAVYQKI